MNTEGYYWINIRTNRLHIDGFCSQSKIKPSETKQFKSESDALMYSGGHLLMCKNCQKKRDKMIEQMNKEYRKI